MATDPTQQVSAHERALVVHAGELLDRFARISPSVDIPIVTVSLDWRIEGTNPGRQPDEYTKPSLDDSNRDGSKRPQVDEGEESARRRPARRLFEEQMQDLVESYGPRGDIFESLSDDADRILKYLDSEVDPAARGVFIVSCSAKGLFEAATFALPLPNRISAGPTPSMSEVARLGEDYPTYAVLLADQHDATLSFITYAMTEREIALESVEYPVKQQQGGWSQRRYQARADERVEAFARDIAEETRKALDELRIDTVIVAGDEVITSALDSAFHESVKNRVVDTLHLDIRTTEKELIEATSSVAERSERNSEAESVTRLRDAIGEGTRGVGGAEAVISSLQAGQVDTLIMADDFAGRGWADFSLPAYGVGDAPESHPLGGDTANLVSIDLREEMIRLAILTDADIEIVSSSTPVDTSEGVPDAGNPLPRTESAQALDAYEGVGAILRFGMNEHPSEERAR